MTFFMLPTNNAFDVDATGAVHVYITDFGVSQIMPGAGEIQFRVNDRVKTMSVSYASCEVLVAWFGAQV